MRCYEFERIGKRSRFVAQLDVREWALGFGIAHFLDVYNLHASFGPFYCGLFIHPKDWPMTKKASREVS